jgi:hypothetical protein
MGAKDGSIKGVPPGKDEEKGPWVGVIPTTGHEKVLAPRMCRSTNRRAEPEVYFRIVHATQDSWIGAPVTTFRDQTVEIVFEPK